MSGVTEKEAKTRWCPFARMHSQNGGAYNRAVRQGSSTPTLISCLASECMAWRWHPGKQTAAYLAAVQAEMQKQAKPNFNTAGQTVWAARQHEFERTAGFCGLAGQP